MSASEKLKALDGWPTDGITSERPAVWSLMEVLPQIVAVVEAAEKYPAPGQDGWIHVYSALSALEEALG